MAQRLSPDWESVRTADTKDQLDTDTDAILSTARKRMCQMAILKYQQMDGLNTVLPIGTRKLNAFRTLTTESLAVFMPFKVQEIMDKGGIYFGENAISHNLIMCNKENLLNQSAFLLGVPGSGKSFSAKELMTFLMLNTEDDILVCDPEGEYAPLVEVMGDMGSVIHISAFFNSAWRQFRKRNAFPTAITQNVEYLLDSVQASTMLSNSEFIVMLNQAASDREKLGRLLNISNEQMNYITNVEAGSGLIKYGSAPAVGAIGIPQQLRRRKNLPDGRGCCPGCWDIC